MKTKNQKQQTTNAHIAIVHNGRKHFAECQHYHPQALAKVICYLLFVRYCSAGWNFISLYFWVFGKADVTKLELSLCVFFSFFFSFFMFFYVCVCIFSSRRRRYNDQSVCSHTNPKCRLSNPYITVKLSKQSHSFQIFASSSKLIEAKSNLENYMRIKS